jgi:hypothetical protein
MPSMSSVRLQRVAPYFAIGWLVGWAVVAHTSPAEPTLGNDIRTQIAEFYHPPLHPVTVAIGQMLFSVLGLAVFSRRRLDSAPNARKAKPAWNPACPPG